MWDRRKTLRHIVQREPHNVLCIEDDGANLQLIRQVFARRSDICLLTATSGIEGLVLARDTSPAVVLLDIRLPDMDGEEVLHLLRADPNTASIPVIIVTADVSARRKQSLLDAGAEMYITKPIDVHQLVDIVDTMIRDHATI